MAHTSAGIRAARCLSEPLLSAASKLRTFRLHFYSLFSNFSSNSFLRSNFSFLSFCLKHRQLRFLVIELRGTLSLRADCISKCLCLVTSTWPLPFERNISGEDLSFTALSVVALASGSSPTPVHQVSYEERKAMMESSTMQ